MPRKNISKSTPIDYTLESQKISFEFLKSHLWSAADILRGSLTIYYSLNSLNKVYNIISHVRHKLINEKVKDGLFP